MQHATTSAWRWHAVSGMRRLRRECNVSRVATQQYKHPRLRQPLVWLQSTDNAESAFVYMSKHEMRITRLGHQRAMLPAQRQEEPQQHQMIFRLLRTDPVRIDLIISRVSKRAVQARGRPLVHDGSAPARLTTIKPHSSFSLSTHLAHGSSGLPRSCPAVHRRPTAYRNRPVLAEWCVQCRPRNAQKLT